MGASESRATLGERVKAAQQSLSTLQKEQSTNIKLIQSLNGSTIDDLLLNFENCILSRSPIPEQLIFGCWYANNNKCEKNIIKLCSKYIITTNKS